MSSVELELAEWQVVINALAMTNPVLVKISSQLAQQPARDTGLPSANAPPGSPVPSGPGAGQGILRPGNSKEPHHEF